MNISATIKNSTQNNEIVVATNGNEKNIQIPAKAEGRGSSVNGGELLFLALATCYCNDVYREATKRNMEVEEVEVAVTGAFGKEGDPASNICYKVRVLASKHAQQEITDLINYVDNVAEVHNTLRKGVAVSLNS